MSTSSKKQSGSSIGCGCFLWVFVLAAWGFSAMMFQKMPDYEKVMEQGEVVEGVVVRVEEVENITINDRHPRRVIYRYGKEEGEMTMALRESTKEGKAIKVRVLGDHAYPEDITPFTQPSWLKFALIGGFILGAIMIGGGIFKLLVIGGVLFAAGRAAMKNNETPPPPPPPPPAPPA